MREKAEIMVVTAHPDDSEFGAAGSVARWTREGKNAVYIVCTNGDKGTNDRTMKQEELVKIREEEERCAAAILGVREVVFLGYPDQSLEDTHEFRKEIVRWIRAFRPDTVITADPYRKYIWHRDHRISGQVTLDAIFPFARDHLAYPDLLEEGLEPHKVKDILFWASDNPNYFSDITDTFDAKRAALMCHKSQISANRQLDLDKFLIERARKSAEGQDFELGEAFYRIEIPF